MKIYKYPLNIMLDQEVRLPKGAAILSVQEQGGQLMLWAMIDPYVPTEAVRISIFGTGNDFIYDPRMIFVSTVQSFQGLVWHVFRWAP